MLNTMFEAFAKVKEAFDATVPPENVEPATAEQVGLEEADVFPVTVAENDRLYAEKTFLVWYMKYYEKQIGAKIFPEDKWNVIVSRGKGKYKVLTNASETQWKQFSTLDLQESFYCWVSDRWKEEMKKHGELLDHEAAIESRCNELFNRHWIEQQMLCLASEREYLNGLERLNRMANNEYVFLFMEYKRNQEMLQENERVIGELQTVLRYALKVSIEDKRAGYWLLKVF